MNGAPPPPPIDIRPRDWSILRDILREHLPRLEVWAFGSRVTGRSKPFSDLDLAVITREPLALATRAALNDALCTSDLPWTVDVIDWAATSASFKAIVEQEKVVVQPAPGPSGE